VIAGRRLVENQYCVGSLLSILGLDKGVGLDQGVGLDEVQIEVKTLNFK
jgi:hypothetical protein